MRFVATEKMMKVEAQLARASDVEALTVTVIERMVRFERVESVSNFRRKRVGTEMNCGDLNL